MAASFFQKARDKATEAAASAQAYVQQQQQSHSNQNPNPNHSHSHSQSQDSTTSTSNANQSSGGISSVVPHLLRTGFATYDPRFESTRSFHILSTSLKNISIDHTALCKQNKTAAANTFRWGQDHIPGQREDGVGDAALVDVTDRLAYILSTIGDLHEAHSKRSELARAELKQVRNPEKDLAQRRAKRVAIKKELSTLVPERAKKDQTAKIVDLEAQLKKLEVEDKEDEERVAGLKRTALRDGYEGLFDSLIELGEKLALISRYGKLLTHVIPVGETPPFPSQAQHLSPGEPSWAGASKVAEIRRSIEPALKNYQPIVKVPDVFDTLNPNARSNSTTTVGTQAQGGGVSLQDPQVIGQQGGGISSGVGNFGIHQLSDTPIHSSAASIISSSDTVSYAVSHAEELTDETSSTTHGGFTMENQRRQSQQSLSPLPQGGSLPPNLNMSPTFGNASVTSPISGSTSTSTPPNLPNRDGSVKHRVPPLPSDVASPLPPNAPQPPTPNPSDLNLNENNLPPSQSVHNLATSSSNNDGNQRLPTAPDDPTYAETGKPIVGPGGPKSGSLGTPRRPSNVNNERPESSSLTGGAAAHSQYQSKAQEAEAERERARLSGDGNLNANVSARIRRDGTVVRRGEADFQQAEDEGLPVYQAVETSQSGDTIAGNQSNESPLQAATRNEASGGKGQI